MLPVLVIFLSNATVSLAPLADQPALHAGDTWRYRNTTEMQGRFNETHGESSVVRVEGDAVVLRNRQIDSTLQPVEMIAGSDWSRFRSINGKEQVVNRPFAFPLTPGKTWTVDYTELNPNRAHSSEHLTLTYRVVGNDHVTVPAGSYDAIKVEATGRWSATMAPGTNSTIVTHSDASGAAAVNSIDRQSAVEFGGRLYKAFWYVPAVRRPVKTVEEVFSSTGVRSENSTSELESFAPGE